MTEDWKEKIRRAWEKETHLTPDQVDSLIDEVFMEDGTAKDSAPADVLMEGSVSEKR